MTNPTSIFTTTKIRSAFRAFVAAVVGSVISWGVTKWGSLHVGVFATLVPFVSAAYYAGVSWLEKKFPALGWLLGILPQPTPPAVIVPPPAK